MHYKQQNTPRHAVPIGGFSPPTQNATGGALHTSMKMPQPKSVHKHETPSMEQRNPPIGPAPADHQESNRSKGKAAVRKPPEATCRVTSN